MLCLASPVPVRVRVLAGAYKLPYKCCVAVLVLTGTRMSLHYFPVLVPNAARGQAR